MTNLREIFRAAFVIGRRDFSATVMSKTFLFFLLGPLFPIIFGVSFAGLGQQVNANSAQPAVAVISSQNDYALLVQQREKLSVLRGDKPLVELTWVAPRGDLGTQRDALLKSEDRPIIAVLDGGLAAPHLTNTGGADSQSARQVGLFVEQAQIAQHGPVQAGAVMEITTIEKAGGRTNLLRSATARGGQLLIFILTLMLATMLLSQLIEEKANKVIEVLASAVPVDAIFLGKLFAMLATSLIGIAVWGSLGAVAIAMLNNGGLSALPAPAAGWVAYLVLILIYFSTTYLLVGAVFLGIGAHASTPREVQIMSLPVTMAQVMLLGFASLAVGQPNSKLGIAASVFPLPSPMAMAARAAEVPGLGWHVVAVLWQILWVAIILRLSASFFRRSVLKSGTPVRRLWPWAAKA